MNWKLFVFCLCLAVLLLPLLARVEAGDAKGQAVGPLSADTKVLPSAPMALAKAKLKNTIVNTGFGGGSTAGFVALDALTELDCPTTHCTYEAVQHVQAQSSTANNRFAICTQVDGAYIGTPNCAYLGVLPPDGWYHAGTFNGVQTVVTTGPHFVQTFLYTDNGSTVANWGITYNMYKTP